MKTSQNEPNLGSEASKNDLSESPKSEETVKPLNNAPTAELRTQNPKPIGLNPPRSVFSKI